MLSINTGATRLEVDLLLHELGDSHILDGYPSRGSLIILYGMSDPVLRGGCQLALGCSFD